jgi:hypothetical protein
MSGSYDDESRWDDPVVIWVAIALVCIIALLGNVIVWLVLHDSTDGSNPGTPGTAGASQAETHDQSGLGTGGNPAPSKSLVAQCSARWHQEVAPFRAAETAIDQWRTHVTAMNKLVSGTLSITQATNFWNRTRIGAKHHIEQFERATSQFQQNAPDCAPHHAQGMSGEGGAMDRCMRAVTIGDRLLALANVTIRTWEHHVHHMEMLRRGEITAAQAAQMWLSSWRAGSRQLHRYDVVSRQAVYVRCP